MLNRTSVPNSTHGTGLLKVAFSLLTALTVTNGLILHSPYAKVASETFAESAEGTSYFYQLLTSYLYQL